MTREEVIQDRWVRYLDGLGRRQEGVHRRFLALAVSHLMFLSGFRNAGVGLIARSKHHRQVMVTLKLWILSKADSCLLCLLLLPLTLGCEQQQQVPVPGQQLFGGILNYSVCPSSFSWRHFCSL